MNGFGGASGESGQALVDEAASSAVPGRNSGLAGTEDVNLGAGLPLLDLDGVGGDEAGENKRSGSDLHFELNVLYI